MQTVDETLKDTKKINIIRQKLRLQFQRYFPPQSVMRVEVLFLQKIQAYDCNQHVDHHIRKKERVEQGKGPDTEDCLKTLLEWIVTILYGLVKCLLTVTEAHALIGQVADLSAFPDEEGHVDG